MAGKEASPRRPDYGIDAPPVIRNLLIAAVAGLLVGVALLFYGASPPVGVILRDTGFGAGLGCLLMAGAMVWSSKVGKLRARERWLALLPWRGDETVLDVGCGRGLMLIGAARRLTTGKAVGVDIWQAEDLSGNRPEATLENARLEAVGDRVEVKDGDARQLPFGDATFDVVVSSTALHNIYNAPERDQAVREIARVLKPGGRVLLVDIRHTADYARILRACGLTDVRRAASSVLTWPVMLLTWGAVRAYRVTGRKPA